ncbi:MAG: hypothetical protein ACI4EO_00375 [Blautia sp.]
MRVVIMENTLENLRILTECIHALLPNALVKGFTDGDKATAWCNQHSSEVELFFGNWWGIFEEYQSPEGSAVLHNVIWKQKPKAILIGDEERFRKWSLKNGADGFLLRPATVPKLRDLLEIIDI